METRKVAQVYEPMPASDGAGVRLLRSIGSPRLNHFDPFLLLDEFRSDNPGDYIGGFPPHPHRGFETVTYMIAGLMRHEDSIGEAGDLTPGSVQWMTAGRGIVHSEMPQQKDALIWGFQLWVNLPAKDKITKPRYQNIAPEEIPSIERKNGATVKVIAGEVDGVTGPVNGIATEPTYIDVTLVEGTEFNHPVPESHNALAYVMKGRVDFGDERVFASRLVTFGDGGQVAAKAGPEGGRFLIIAGRPINEPIARYGPFVMNTNEQIEQAIEDYRAGTFV